jgi:hypothetical protein
MHTYYVHREFDRKAGTQYKECTFELVLYVLI